MPANKLPDYYNILRLPADATFEEIRASYKRLALKVHPDVNKSPDAKAEFQRVQEAYEILSHAGKRAAYDDVFFRPKPPAVAPPRQSRARRRPRSGIRKSTRPNPTPEQLNAEAQLRETLETLADLSINTILFKIFSR